MLLALTVPRSGQFSYLARSTVDKKRHSSAVCNPMQQQEQKRQQVTIMNRRNSDRIEPLKQQRLTLRILDLTFDVKPENISPSGVYLSVGMVGMVFPVTMMLKLELSYADTSATCMAYVWHRHNRGVGLAFVNPSARFCELISAGTEPVDPALPLRRLG